MDAPSQIETGFQSGIDPALLDAPYFVEQRNVVLLPDDPRYYPVIPKSTPRIELAGRTLLPCRNTSKLNKLLRGLGVVMPSPLLHDGYDWAHASPFHAQKITAGMLVTEPYAYVLNDMGTGKTRATLFAIDWLIMQGMAKRALVVAPLSVLWQVWQQEMVRHVPRLRPVVLHGTADARRELLASRDWNVAVINPDGLKVLLPQLTAMKFHIVVFDELATFRTPTTKRWKRAKAITERADYLWGLTGSPTPNGPWDAYGQLKLITPWNASMSLKRFEDLVAIRSNDVLIARRQAPDMIHRLMQPAVRFALDEVAELPEVVELERACVLSYKQKLLFDALRRHMLAEYDGGRVIAANAGVLVNKLMQVCSGCVYTSDGAEEEYLDLEPSDRIDQLAETLESTDAKVIVFVPYKHICTLLPKKLGVPCGPGKKSDIVYGPTSAKDRRRIFEDFCDPNSPLRWLFAQPGTMAHGLNLIEADTVVWWSPINSREIEEQANHRITRVGQKRKQRIVRMWATSIETKVYHNLKMKANLQRATLKLFEDRLT